MPNWAFSKVTISGDYETVTEIKNRLATPYASPYNPEEMKQGVFLLWNIIKPNNLEAYLGKEQKAFDEIINADPELAELKEPEPNSPDLESIMDKVIREMATSDNWYEWNCRNWGTKWEIGDKAILEYELPSYHADDSTHLELGYRMESAWAPPYEAINKLAEQYPDITINLSSIDESDCWAMSAQWIDGKMFYEQDEDITHNFGMDLRGYCNLECCNEYE